MSDPPPRTLPRTAIAWLDPLPNDAITLPPTAANQRIAVGDASASPMPVSNRLFWLGCAPSPTRSAWDESLRAPSPRREIASLRCRKATNPTHRSPLRQRRRAKRRQREVDQIPHARSHPQQERCRAALSQRHPQHGQVHDPRSMHREIESRYPVQNGFTIRSSCHRKSRISRVR